MFTGIKKRVEIFHLHISSNFTTVKPVLSGYSKKDKAKILTTNDSLHLRKRKERSGVSTLGLRRWIA